MSIQFVAALLKSPLHRASYVTRYSTRPVTHAENIAEHAYYVTVYTYLIAQELTETAINTSTLLLQALFHDIDECVTGDFQRQFKYSNPILPKIIHEAAVNLVPGMFTDFKAKNNIFDNWLYAKNDTIEGSIVVVADFLAVITYIWRELQFGNQAILDIFDECIKYGESIKPRLTNDELVGIVDAAIMIIANKRREYAD